MSSTQKKITSSAEIQDYWINNIAPNYFDFDTINNYRTGVFGYVNETMATSVMDVHHAVNIARREFYPVSAQYPQSIYKMAALQKKDIPLATPARCKAILLLDRDEILANSTWDSNKVGTCVIDNTTQIFADNIPFSLLYPIVIVSNIANGEWNHTVHYDKSKTNSLDKNIASNYYLTTKAINQDGKRYLLVSVKLAQVSLETISELVTTDSSLGTVSMLFSFEGTLANFEVFYVDDTTGSKPIQLKKLMDGQAMIEQPFCYYRLLNSNLIELTFPKNIYFTPKLNSEIHLNIYTSLGKAGEFDRFDGSLSCTMESEEYPYNNNMSLIGVVDGSSTGAKDCPALEEYRGEIQDAYATNNTITTTNDLQIVFDKLSDDVNNRVLFRKRRMDAFSRDYGAFMLLKDKKGNVVPTNTLSVAMQLEDFDVYNGASGKAYIKPGAIFEYTKSDNDSIYYTASRATDKNLSDDLSEYDKDASSFLFTNPFLIAVNLNPNLVGYYNNSVNTISPVEYSYINDASVMQFIGSNLCVNRNSMIGENFYKFSINISPTTTLDINSVVTIPSVRDEDYYIIAEQNGKVIGIVYEESMVICRVEYEDTTTEDIIVSSTVAHIDNEYIYTTGYKMNFNVFDTFIEGDILATKKVTDLGIIRSCLNFESILYEADLYIPLVIEDYDRELNVFTLCGYVSTDDVIDNNTILLEHGIFNMNGNEDDNVTMKSTDLTIEVSVFYDNNASANAVKSTKYESYKNIPHKYSNYDYFKKHTLTNTYKDSSEDRMSFIEHIDFIKSTLVYTENDTEEVNPETDIDDGYTINIKEIPFVKASWIKETSNFNYLMNALILNYHKLKEIYYELENNYSIDLKFYNTYGISRFFRVGIKREWTPLNHINLSFKFGVYLRSTTAQSTFLEQFREYVKSVVESINTTASGQSIYIFNLAHDIIDKFSELGYVEYYGFDEYGTDIQKIEPVPTTELSDDLVTNYIPEFINICTYVENGENVPNIEVEFLQSHEE